MTIAPPPSGETLASAYTRLARALAEAAVDTPGADARRLLEAATGLPLAAQIADPARPLTDQEHREVEAFLARRLDREPVSRILGWREFYGRPFLLTPDVLDPRADSETLIAAALQIATQEQWRDRPISILDLGTGSGCLLLTLLAELPRAVGVGLDISQGALACAAMNANALGLGPRCRFQHADMASARLDGFDLVISNPPYIRHSDIAGLAPEVSRFDPRQALAGGLDGLDFYRAIIARLSAACAEADTPPWLVLELGAGQYEQVSDLIERSAALFVVSQRLVLPDLAGHIRCMALKPQSMAGA